MTIKKRLSILILLFNVSFLISQNIEKKDYTLKWNDNSVISVNKDNSITLPLVINNFFDQNNIPIYTTSFNVKKNLIVHSYQIKNVKFLNLPTNSTKHININEVPTELTSEFNIGNSNKNSVVILTLTPIIKKGNQIKKVISFTLEYKLQPKNLSAKRKGTPLPTYTSSSVLANGTWYKFSVDTTGVFKIDRKLLKDIGINPSNINPKNIKIYGNGGALLPQLNSSFRYDDLQENAIYIEGEDDNQFDDNDFILFYAKGPHSWNIDTVNLSLTKHQTNIYSDLAYYFITVDNGIGKRINSANEINQPANEQIRNYQDFLVHEIEKVNLFANGQQWLGENFSAKDIRNFQFNFNDIDDSEDLIVRIRGVVSSFTNTKMDAKINGQDLLTLNFNALSSITYSLAVPVESISNANINQEQIDIEITYNNLGNPSAIAHLDYIEILGTKKLIAHDKQFSFRNIYTNDSSKVYEYQIQNSSNISQLWDVTDFINPKQITNQSNDNDFTFKSFGGNLKEFIIINENNFLIPKTIKNGTVKNQNLHKLQDVDYIIITQDFLSQEAERLADYHRVNSNLNTLVIELDQIYNEFGSGSPDLTAIRDFIRFLYLNASSSDKRIKYVCLFGDSSFNFKDKGLNNGNIVPAFQSFESFNRVSSYVTDDYYGIMDDNEGELKSFDLQDVAMGRFPITTSLEAKEAVDKALNYYHTSSYGDWRNSITLVADDPDRPNEFVLQQAVDFIAEDIKVNKPGFNIKKIYSDAHQQETSAGGERYPTVRDAITNAIEIGTLIIDYFGHGGINGWADERILEVPQIQKWNNFNTLPLLITVTCEFTRFDDPSRPSAGEFVLLNPRGGATSMISTTRDIFISVGQAFNKNLMKKLLGFQDEGYTIAEALMHTKNDFSSVQRFFIYTFGDPAMKLAQPKPNILITKINDKNISQSLDTLKALSHIKLEGIVTDNSNNILNNYNGTLSATIYDKPLDKTTLDNDNFGRKMKFTSIESKIFRGRASIKNGAFSFDFIVPRDIRIAYGNAKVSFYADDKNTDKSGYNLQIKIGGIDPNAPIDNEGPNIQLFMNDESFVDGGNTSESPIIYAILEDESGINTSITAVDHDITAVLDGDNANPFVLNDYYETELDNFKKGKVKFPLRNLEPGLHTLKFKCWDTYNNPSESTLSFIVVDDNDLVLSNVLNYPNPFINYTEFWFNHNKPSETLEVLVQIFTVSGKLIKTLNKSVQSEGLLSREITWDGLDDFGNKIGKGVYIYKLQVKSSLSNTKAEKIEKLVILQ
ncbi:MAG: type IX secretion system sortase PorU [Flavobacteriaceae bacterium]|nr:type IX secretion system sortase PorU [Flavobacteriaceae bacterium]